MVLEFIKECFDGVFVSDFWYAYNVLSCAKQKCLVHLLRDLERVWKSKDHSGDWPRFSKKLKRLIRDAIRLRKRIDELDAAVYQRRCQRIEKRLDLIITHEWSNKEAQRLIKRLKRHHDELFTFLSNREVRSIIILANAVSEARWSCARTAITIAATAALKPSRF